MMLFEKYFWTFSYDFSQTLRAIGVWFIDPLGCEKDYYTHNILFQGSYSRIDPLVKNAHAYHVLKII